MGRSLGLLEPAVATAKATAALAELDLRDVVMGGGRGGRSGQAAQGRQL